MAFNFTSSEVFFARELGCELLEPHVLAEVRDDRLDIDGEDKGQPSAPEIANGAQQSEGGIIGFEFGGGIFGCLGALPRPSPVASSPPAMVRDERRPVAEGHRCSAFGVCTQFGARRYCS